MQKKTTATAYTRARTNNYSSSFTVNICSCVMAGDIAAKWVYCAHIKIEKKKHAIIVNNNTMKT